MRLFVGLQTWYLFKGLRYHHEISTGARYGHMVKGSDKFENDGILMHGAGSELTSLAF